MPLDVTAGPPLAAAGSGPPGPAGGSPEAAQMPGGRSAPPFAVWLAQQNPQAQPVPVPKSANAVTESMKATDNSQNDDDDAADDSSAVVPSPPDTALVIDWTALATQQAPPPMMPTQTATLTADATVSSAPTKNTEAMDTVPTTAALPAQTADTGRELLSIPAASPTPAVSSAEGQAGVALSQGSPVAAALPTVAPTDDVSARLQPDGSASPAATLTTATLTALPAAVALPMGGAVDTGVPLATQPSPTASADSQTVLPVAALPASAVPVPQISPTPVTEAVPSPTAAVAAAVTQAAEATAAMTGVKPTLGPRPALAPLTAASREQPKSATKLAAPNAPAVALTVADVLSTPVAAAQSASDEKSAPITLQNDAAPANNTGRTASSGAAAAPGSNTTAPAGEIGDGHPAMVTSSKPPVFSPEKAAQQPLISRSARPKEKDDAEEADPSPPSTPETASPSATEIASLAAQTTDGTANTASPADTPKSLTGAERAQVMQQLADGVATVKPHVLAHGQGQMTLDLHPKEWGDLRVTIKLAQGQTADGLKQTVITAHVIAGSPVVKAALETHTGELNRALQETGLRLDRLTITVQAASAGSASDGTSQGGQSSDQPSSDRWQQAQTQASAGNSSFGNGSSSFASFSERQGSGAFQSPVMSRSGYPSHEDADAGTSSAATRLSGTSAGFDQRV